MLADVVNMLADVVSKLTTLTGVPCKLMKKLMTQKEKKNPGAYANVLI